MKNLYRLLPSVDICLREFRDCLHPHALLCDTINAFLEEKRTKIKNAQMSEHELERDVLFAVLKEYVELA